MHRRGFLVTLGLSRLASSRRYQQRPSGAALCPEYFGAAGDGSRDDTLALRRALRKAATTRVPLSLRPGARYTISGTVECPSFTHVEGNHASIDWDGHSGEAMLESDATGPVERFEVQDLALRPSAAGACIRLHSAQHCRVSNIEIVDGSATLTVLDLDTAVRTVPRSLRRSVMMQNRFEDIRIDTCGTGIRLRGQRGSVDAPVTLNVFEAIEMLDVRAVGIDLVRDADNNYFRDVLVTLRADESKAVVFNSDTPDRWAGVFANSIENLAVDAWGDRRGRVGIEFNRSRENVITGYLDVEPKFVDKGAESFRILDRRGRDDIHTRQYCKGERLEGEVALSGQLNFLDRRDDYRVGLSLESGSLIARDTSEHDYWFLRLDPDANRTTIRNVSIGADGSEISEYVRFDIRLVLPAVRIGECVDLDVPLPADLSDSHERDSFVLSPRGLVPQGLLWCLAGQRSRVITLRFANVARIPSAVAETSWTVGRWSHEPIGAPS